MRDVSPRTRTLDAALESPLPAMRRPPASVHIANLHACLHLATMVGAAGLSTVDDAMSGTLLIVAATSAGIALLLSMTRRARSGPLINALAVALLLGLTSRVIVLTLDPNRYYFVRRGQRLDYPALQQAMIGFALPCFSLIAGWAVAVSLYRHLTHIRAGHRLLWTSDGGRWATRDLPQSAIAVLPPLLRITGIASLLLLVLSVLGIFTTTPAAGSPQGVFMRLVPTEMFLYVALSALILWRRSIARSTQYWAVCTIASLSLFSGMAGQRSALFAPLIVAFILATVTGTRVRIRPSRVTLVSVAMILALPAMYNFVIGNRSTSSLSAQEGSLSATDIAGQIDARLGAVDLAVPVVQKAPSGPFAPSLGGIAATTVSAFVPNRFYPADALPLGKAYGVLYQGHSLELAHYGAWSGSGLNRALGPRSTFVAFAATGFLAGLAIVFLSRRSAALQVPIQAFILEMLFTQAILSANLDVLISRTISEIFLMSALVFVVKIVRRRPSPQCA